MNAIVPYQDIERMAGAMVQSNLFGLKNTEQAIALMLVAQAEGLHPATVAVDYDFIQGKPTKKPVAMLRDFIKGGGKVEWHALDDTQADATFSHPNGGTVRVKWDMEKAQKAQLSNKDMWKKYPAAMLRSRCVSEGLRAVFPAATGGLYTPEEAGDMPHANGNGHVIEAEVIESETLTKDEAANIETLLADTKSDKALFLRWCRAESIEKIKRSQYKACIDRLNEKLRETA